MKKIIISSLLPILLSACLNTNIERSKGHFLPILNNLRCADCLTTSQAIKNNEEEPITPQPPPPDIINFQISPSSIFAYLTWTNPVAPNFQHTRILRRSDNFPNSPSDPSATLVYQGNGTEHLDGILTHQTNYFYAAYVYDGEQFSNGVTLNTTTMKSGDLDPNFIPPSVGNVRSVFIQDDRKILVAGNHVRRLLPSGAPDSSFSTGSVNILVQKVIQHPNGKIYAFGDFTTYNSVTMNRIARLNSDGTVDSSLAIGTGTNNSVFDAHVYPDGSFIIGGNFTSYNSTTANRILKILSNGIIDSSFTIGSGFNNSVLNLTVQEDGKIFVTGSSFTHYNGTARNRVARLHSNGTLDASLPIGLAPLGPNSLVRSHFVLEDGKYLISGEFNMCNSVSVPKIARLNLDGTLDTSFTPGAGLVGIGQNIWRFLKLPNNKLIIVGSFTSYDSVVRNRIARLNENGSLDMGFDPGTGADNIIHDVKFTHDGRLLIGGYFTSYNGNSISNVAKVYP